jgi:hypothetical protein
MSLLKMKGRKVKQVLWGWYQRDSRAHKERVKEGEYGGSTLGVSMYENETC